MSEILAPLEMAGTCRSWVLLSPYTQVTTVACPFCALTVGVSCRILVARCRVPGGDCDRHMEFEWDPNKAAGNLRKHGVSFAEAATVFGDVLSITVFDPHRTADEDRYITVGMSSRLRLLIVAHSERGDRIRIVSARELTRFEREQYERGDYRA